MKFSIIAASIAALAVSAGEARAQRDDSFVWGVGGGATIESGYSADNHSTGGHGTLMVGVGAVDSPFGVKLEGMYSSLGNNSDSGLAFDQGRARVFTLMGSGIFSLYGGNRRLYAVTGLGGFWYNPDGEDSNATNDFGVTAGLGFWIPGLNAFVEARWLNLYRALPDPVTGLKGKKSARLFPVTVGFIF